MSDIFTVTQVAEGIWAIDEKIVRCWLVAGEEHAVLIDSGASGAAEELAELVNSLLGEEKRPVSLVFTHTDGDHTAGQDAFDQPLLHPAEYDYYSSKGNAGRELRALWEGDVLELGGRSLEVVLLPGHTPGSIALLDRASQRLFVGDTLSDSWIFLIGPGRNVPAFIESLRKLASLAETGAFDVVHPCHGTASLGTEWITRTLTAAQLLLAGELTPHDPPMPLPCKAYVHEGVTLLYNE
jgi:glyoxylase-like metal-dependent hydrolase (beta-lactamase superfamily II)